MVLQRDRALTWPGFGVGGGSMSGGFEPDANIRCDAASEGANARLIAREAKAKIYLCQTRRPRLLSGFHGRRRQTFRPQSLFTRLFMRTQFIKWFFIVCLLGSGTVYSALILLLFPFVGRSGRYWLAAQWCRAMVAWMRWLPGVTCSVEGLEHLRMDRRFCCAVTNRLGRRWHFSRCFHGASVSSSRKICCAFRSLAGCCVASIW